MKSSISILFLLMVHWAIAQRPQSVDITSSQFEDEVDALVDDYLALDIFSGVVLIAKEGQPVYHKAFGLADRKNNIPNKLDTRFDIGSMNKSFTKVLILQLVSEGVLSLDDRLGDHLSGFPQEAANNITIEHLLNHQSGYGGYHTPEYWNMPYEQKSLKSTLEHIKAQPLLFPPGQGREYSNAGYVILGMIAQEAAGQSYFELINDRIVSPMGMTNTFLTEKYKTPHRAIGYYKNMKGELFDNEEFREIPTPAGGFYSTTMDMLKFYRAYHYGDHLWDNATRQLDDMYDFYQEHLTTGGAMSHAGGFEGTNTVHYEILRDQVSVLVFANMDEVVAESLGAGILALIRGQEPDSPQLPATQMVFEAFIENGAEYVQNNWDRLTSNFHPQDPKDLILNHVGYNLLFDGDTDLAVELFKLNTVLFPAVANCWDSYGEGLLKKGEQKKALDAYEKALKIDPGLTSAKDAVKSLTADR